MPNNVTESSLKDDISTAAIEFVEIQEEELSALRQRQLVLISLAGFLFIIHLLF